MDFESIKDALSHEFQNNEFFKGGAVIALMTWLWMQVKVLPSKVTNLWDRFGAYRVEFDQGSQDFDAVVDMVMQLHAESRLGHFVYVPSTEYNQGIMVPMGQRWSWHGTCWLRTMLSKRELHQGNDWGRATTFTLTVTAYGFRKRVHLQTMVDKAVTAWKARNHGKLHVQDYHHNYWHDSVPLPARTFDNVYSDWAARIKEDLDAFLAREEEYVKRGIPWRRGYCLHGPPGTGKTSMALAIANYLKRDLRVFERSIAKELHDILSGDNGLVLIEDIDTFSTSVASRDTKKKKKGKQTSAEQSTGYTLGEILNALDGVKSGHGAIVLITTNHVQDLDKALLRPGRIDMLCEMTHMTPTEWDMLCESYFGEKLAYPTEKITAAEAQAAYQRAGFDNGQFLIELDKVRAESLTRK